MTDEEIKCKIQLGRQYQHYKGEIYTVDSFAMDAETSKLMVVYHNNRNDVYVGAAIKWLDVVTIPCYTLIKSSNDLTIQDILPAQPVEQTYKKTEFSGNFWYVKSNIIYASTFSTPDTQGKEKKIGELYELPNQLEFINNSCLIENAPEMYKILCDIRRHLNSTNLEDSIKREIMSTLASINGE